MKKITINFDVTDINKVEIQLNNIFHDKEEYLYCEEDGQIIATGYVVDNYITDKLAVSATILESPIFVLFNDENIGYVANTQFTNEKFEIQNFKQYAES